MARIAILEDQEMLLYLLKDLCEQDARHVVPIVATRGDELREKMRSIEVDVVSLDLNLPDCDGPELARELISEHPNLRILAVSGDSTEVTLTRTLAAGVHGFVDKNAAPTELLTAIKAVEQGETYFTEFVRAEARQSSESAHPFGRILSRAEMRLLPDLGQGLPNEDVAKIHALSPATVQTHRRNLMKKLDLHSTPELIRFALEMGFVRLRGDGSFSQSAKTPFN
ncbi:MAG: response regulator transcription factor [Synoicihabitans sp.]